MRYPTVRAPFLWSGFYVTKELPTYLVSRKGIFFLYGTTNDTTAMLHAKQCNFRGLCVHTLQQYNAGFTL